MNARFFRICATLGPIGYLPAPGTLASLVTLPIIYWLHYMVLPWAYAAITVVLIVLSWRIINSTCEAYAWHDDPPVIVLDEVMGMLLSFWLIPWSADIVILAFLLFRFFDITKIAGISYMELFKGAGGILADDLLAAIYTQIFVHLYIWFMY